MAEGMFGAPVGISQGLQDSRQDALASMQILKSAGELSEIPSQIAGREALARQHNAAAAKAETEAAQQRAMMARLALRQSTEKSGKAVNIAEELSGLGSDALAVGDFDLGQKLLNASSLVTSRAATAAFRTTQATEIDQRTELAMQRRFGEIAGSARDQQSYNAARMQLAENGMDVSELPENFAEGKPVLDQIANATLTRYQQGMLELRKTTEEATGAQRKLVNQNAADRLTISREQLERQKRRDERLEKNGGKAVGMPNTAMRLGAEAALKEAGITLSKEEQALAGRSIAARAQALMKSNPGIDADTATKMALKEAKEAGDFQAAEGPLSMLPFTKSHTYKGTGRTPAAPIMQVPDAGKRVEGKFYLTPRGTYKWTKGGWIPAHQTGGGAGGSASLSEDDEDEDV